MIIDTHTHIFEKEFDEDRDKVIQRAKDAGVSKMVLPNINTESIGRLKELAMSDRNTFIPAMGLHPTEINANHQDKTVRKHSGIPTYEKTWILVPAIKKFLKQVIE